MGGKVTYAIIQTGGKQYKVEKGSELRVEKLDAEVGQVVQLETVLLVEDGKVLPGKKVTAKVTEHGRGEKLDIFKYKPKKNYRRRMGHRQSFTKIIVEAVA